MNADLLTVGVELPDYRASARLPPDPVENKIHEDGLAKAMGFRGGLVPGVIVYSWMTHPVVEALGPAWLERGTFSVRFGKPVYFDEKATVSVSVAARTERGVTLTARVVDEKGETCGTGTMELSSEAPPSPPRLGDYPVEPLPVERPPVSRAILEGRTVLGTPELMLDEPTSREFLERVSETLTLYRGVGAAAHPGLYLDLANRALSRNVRVSPWIHVESQGRHLGIAKIGERLEMRGKVKQVFEKKGHEFVELDLLLVADGTRPIASIRHVAIYHLRGASS